MLFQAAVFLVAFFEVVRTGVRLNEVGATYPYAFALIGMALCLAGVAMRGPRAEVGPLARGAVVLVTLLLLLTGAHIALRESVLDVLVSLRFYFGYFVLFYGAAAFVRWFAPSAQLALRTSRRLAEGVLLATFFLAILEYASILTGFISPERFWWIRPDTADTYAGYLQTGAARSIRPIGMTANSSVLGAFALFLTLYCFSQIEPYRRRKALWICVAGVFTVVISSAGISLPLLALSAWMVLRRNRRISTATRRRIFVLAACLAVAAVLYEMRPEGRLGAEYLSRLVELWTDTWSFASNALQVHAAAPLIGAFNLRQFSGPNAAALPFGGGVSYYDFALLALLVEFGVVGLFTYIIAWRATVLQAFPREGEKMARWSFVVVLLSTTHYGVAFWMCTQGMMAAIAALHVHAQAIEAGRMPQLP